MNKKILIVDDDRDRLDILEMVFIHQHYQVNVCDYTINMEEFFALKKPDLVIAGFSKYETDGNRLYMLLSKKSAVNIPVILIKGHPRMQAVYRRDFFVMGRFNLFLLLCKVKAIIDVKKVN
jgi:DNA-binding NtrC family response regulator